MFGRFLANISRDLPTLAEISRDFTRDFTSKTREFFDKIKVAERTRKISDLAGAGIRRQPQEVAVFCRNRFHLVAFA